LSFVTPSNGLEVELAAAHAVFEDQVREGNFLVALRRPRARLAILVRGDQARIEVGVRVGLDHLVDAHVAERLVERRDLALVLVQRASARRSSLSSGSARCHASHASTARRTCPRRACPG
jgi:hypothetical protein